MWGPRETACLPEPGAAPAPIRAPRPHTERERKKGGGAGAKREGKGAQLPHAPEGARVEGFGDGRAGNKRGVDGADNEEEPPPPLSLRMGVRWLVGGS